MGSALQGGRLLFRDKGTDSFLWFEATETWLADGVLINLIVQILYHACSVLSKLAKVSISKVLATVEKINFKLWNS